MSTFAPTWESLLEYQCPDWFRDAKFGIWSHWGPQSVPMFGDWYARNIYIQNTPQYLYHLRHYGHPSKFGHKDICALWKAENFDPRGLMDLYKKAGAKYFVAQAMHHDHFFNYPSKLNRFNSSAIGPMKDICGLWKQEAVRAGLPFGLTEHMGASFAWWQVNKHADATGPLAGVPYDGNDPAFRNYYFDNQEHVNPDTETRPWYTSNTKFHNYWLAVMKEVIDLYQPDLFYSDGGLPFGELHKAVRGDNSYTTGLQAVAHLYNTSIKKHGNNRAVFTQKDRRPEIYRIGVLDVEKSQLPSINPEPWHADTCIGSWFYDARQVYKQPGHIIEMLIDIVAKNGSMLLNILQRPDGSIDREAHWILDELAGWFAINAPAIHGTRPWRTLGEGDSLVAIDGFKEDQVKWNSSDIRYTAKAKTLYAHLLNPPENRVAVLKSLTEVEKVTSVQLLGSGPCPFNQSFGVLTVKLPPQLPTKYTNCLAIELA